MVASLCRQGADLLSIFVLLRNYRPKFVIPSAEQGQARPALPRPMLAGLTIKARSNDSPRPYPRSCAFTPKPTLPPDSHKEIYKAGYALCDRGDGSRAMYSGVLFRYFQLLRRENALGAIKLLPHREPPPRPPNPSPPATLRLRLTQHTLALLGAPFCFDPNLTQFILRENRPWSQKLELSRLPTRDIWGQNFILMFAVILRQANSSDLQRNMHKSSTPPIEFDPSQTSSGVHAATTAARPCLEVTPLPARFTTYLKRNASTSSNQPKIKKASTVTVVAGDVTGVGFVFLSSIGWPNRHHASTKSALDQVSRKMGWLFILSSNSRAHTCDPNLVDHWDVCTCSRSRAPACLPAIDRSLRNTLAHHPHQQHHPPRTAMHIN